MVAVATNLIIQGDTCIKQCHVVQHLLSFEVDGKVLDNPRLRQAQRTAPHVQEIGHREGTRGVEDQAGGSLLVIPKPAECLAVAVVQNPCLYIAVAN